MFSSNDSGTTNVLRELFTHNNPVSRPDTIQPGPLPLHVATGGGAERQCSISTITTSASTQPGIKQSTDQEESAKGPPFWHESVPNPTGTENPKPGSKSPAAEQLNDFDQPSTPAPHPNSNFFATPIELISKSILPSSVIQNLKSIMTDLKLDRPFTTDPASPSKTLRHVGNHDLTAQLQLLKEHIFPPDLKMPTVPKKKSPAVKDILPNKNPPTTYLPI